MKLLHKFCIILLVAALTLALVPASAGARGAWAAPGNSDLNILNGGVMLVDGDDFYFNHKGIFVERGDEVTALSADDGRNLNLAGGWLYYTVGKSVLRMPKNGGAAETVHTAAAEIKQLYVTGDTLLYIAGGQAYSVALSGGKAQKISSLTDIKGLIPTPYGNLFLTGETLNYTLRAEGASILSGVRSCYTDSGYLAVQIGNENYMARLDALFGGFSRAKLEAFNIHGEMSLSALLAPDDADAVSEDNDNNKLALDFSALLKNAGFDVPARLMEEEPPTEIIIPEVSQGQRNIVKRARQLHEIEWTPLEDRWQWGERDIFHAEETYTGIPYGQSVNSNGYIGYGVSIDQFAAAMLDNTSKFYTSYSTYNKTAPVFSTDCSGYVSYAWGLAQRRTTYTIPNIAERVGDQSIYSLQIGDCLNHTTSHVVLISDITYDAQGNIIGVEIMEETPVITRLTRYGEGEAKPLASLQSYYLNGGYAIYRYPERGGVTYTPSAAVPLDGETVAGQKDKAPKSVTTAIPEGKTVALYSDVPGAVICYTLNGVAPTANSPRYSGPITIYDTTKLRAIAYTGAYPAGSAVLEYTVKVPQLATPAIAVSEGLNNGSYVAAGSKVKLSSVSGAVIYYTTDGSEPTVNSQKYTAPITVSADVTVKAMAAANGYKHSASASASYRLGAVYTISASAGANGGVSPSGDAKVIQTGSQTYKFTPANGFKVSGVLVDGVSVGAAESYTFSNVSANHTISVTFVSTLTLPFADVKSGAWYYDAVSFAYANSLFNGTSATTFSPETKMTRGMFVTVLGRFAGVSDSYAGGNIGVVTGQGVNIRSGPSTDTDIAGYVPSRYAVVQALGSGDGWVKVRYGEVTGYIREDLIKVYGGNYTDLAINQYYSPHVQWAYLTGIADGVAGNAFDANADITREDMTLLLYNFARVYGKNLAASAAETVFTDDAQMGAAAREAIYAMQRAGIINGMGDGAFAPKGSATRAEVAQIFNKYCAAVKGS